MFSAAQVRQTARFARFSAGRLCKTSRFAMFSGSHIHQTSRFAMLSAARLVKHARFAGFPAVAGCALGAPGGPRRPACRLPLQGWPGLRGQLRGLSERARARARRFVAKRDVFCSAGSPNVAFCEVFCEAPSQNNAFRDVFCHAHKPNAAFRDAFCAPSCQTRVFREVCCWRPAGSWMCSAACGALRERCCCSAGWGCAATCAGSVRATGFTKASRICGRAGAGLVCAASCAG